jgi:cyclic lactone autoinducer peptide
MKEKVLELVACIAEKAIVQANNTASRYWSYEPKAPEGLKNFEK